MAATLAGVWSVAAVGDNPYKDIITRNAFNLKPPEQPKPPEPPVEEKGPSNIVMTGVTSIGGKKQVFLTVTIPGEKDPKYLRLGENERDGAIEIVSIDPKTSRVRIKNSGVSSVISFETHGAKQMMAAAAPTRPGVPGVPGGPIGSPISRAANSSINSAVNNRTRGSSVLPVTSTSTGVRGSRPTSTSSGNSNSPTTRQIPTRQLRITPTTGGGASYQAPAPAPNINPAVQEVQIEVNRAVQPTDFPPLPPTSASK